MILCWCAAKVERSCLENWYGIYLEKTFSGYELSSSHVKSCWRSHTSEKSCPKCVCTTQFFTEVVPYILFRCPVPHSKSTPMLSPNPLPHFIMLILSDYISAPFSISCFTTALINIPPESWTKCHRKNETMWELRKLNLILVAPFCMVTMVTIPSTSHWASLSVTPADDGWKIYSSSWSW